MSSPVVQRVVQINDKDPLGLHIRPAEQFVRLAMKFTCEIEVVRENLRVDGKSMLSMLTLAAMEGTKLSLEATGCDAQQALEALAELFIKNFADEEEMVG